MELAIVQWKDFAPSVEALLVSLLVLVENLAAQWVSFDVHQIHLVVQDIIRQRFQLAAL